MKTLEEKERIWQDTLKKVGQLVDSLGLGVDEGIQETVAAFHVFNINTTASHEGKIDRYPIPYIDVESTEAEELFKKLEVNKEVDKKSIRDEIFSKNLEERKKIIPLLEEFYSDRKVPYEIRIGISSLALGWSRIQSQGGDFQEIEKDASVQKKRLEQFQEEMKAFTDFLKKKYFSEEK